MNFGLFSTKKRKKKEFQSDAFGEKTIGAGEGVLVTIRLLLKLKK